MHLVRGLPAERVDRWPLIVVALGWVSILIATLLSEPLLSGGAWSTMLAGMAVLVLAFWWTGTALLRRVTAAATVAVAVARSTFYALDDAWTPIGVWFIVIGLTFAAYHRTSKPHDA